MESVPAASAVASTSAPAAAAPATAAAPPSAVVVWAGLIVGPTIRSSFSKIRAFPWSDEVETVKEGIKSKWPNDLEHIDVARIELRGGWATSDEARANYASTEPLESSKTLSEGIIGLRSEKIFFVVGISPGASQPRAAG